MQFNSLGMEKTISRDDATGGYALEVGSALGQYRILRPLGRGGMGEVYEAENTASRKRYALKVLPQTATANGNFVDRFRIESRVMSDLRHPHVVQVHHAGEENGIYYLTMDLVAGADGEPVTLEDLLAKGRVSESEVKRLALQICDAVAFAHSKKVIHRDLKPSNVLLDAEWNAQVADFGLAKVVGTEYLQSVIQRSISLSMAEQSLGEAKTISGSGATGNPSSSARALLGTYDYMSPEQKSGAEVTPRTDIFALGVILYRMLAGRKPEGMAKPPSRYGCSKPWDAIVRKCLEIEPSERYATAAELKRDVAKVGRGLGSGHVLALLAAVAVLASGLAVAGAWKAGGIGSEGGGAVLRARPGDGGQEKTSEPEENKGSSQPAVVAETIIQDSPSPEGLAAGGDVAPAEPEVAAPVPVSPPKLSEADYAGLLEIKSEAEVKWRRAAVLDRGEGFGAALDECEKTLAVAQTLYGDKAYVAAKERFGRVASDCSQLLGLDENRQRAGRARGRAAQAQAQARNGGAQADAEATWNEAERLMARANHDFESLDFGAAQRNWDLAERKYAEAQTAAATERRRQQETARMEQEAEIQRQAAAARRNQMIQGIIRQAPVWGR